MEGKNTTRPEDYDFARRLCAEHLGGDWADTSAIDAQILSGGYVNRLFLCSLPKKTSKNGYEKVIVRQLTSLAVGTAPAGEAAEGLAMDIIERAGLGPKLLGAFPGGRIEEFVPSRMLHWRDARDPQYLTAVAHLTARMHSLEVPIRHDPAFKEATTIKFVEDVIARWKTKDLSALSPTTQTQLRTLIEHDYLEELEWMHSTMRQIKTRVVFGRLDHFSNNLLLKDGRGDVVTDKDISIIDMDSIAYFYRGQDIACYLFESGFDYSDT